MALNLSSNPNDPKKTPGTNPKPQPTPPPKKDKNPMHVFLPVSIVVGILLLGVIGYLMYANSSKNRQLEMKVAELQEAEQLRAELEEQYQGALAELEEMRGTNEQLNALIEEQKAELEQQRNRIAGLLRERRNVKAAREELDNLKEQVKQYLAEIEELKAQNQQLTEQNAQLLDSTRVLQTNLQQTIIEKQQLDEARAVLVSEKEELAKTVQLASVIKVKDIQVTGLKTRSNGKTAKRNVAKSIDQLKVCFTTTVNEVTRPGVEKFFIRIINPVGETMAIDDLGSGVIVNKKTGEEIRFTQVQEYDYVNDETQLCFLWEPGTSFQKGTYEVEIYNKGYLAGKSSFSLK